MKRLAIVLVLAACGGKTEETPPTTASGSSAGTGSAPAKPAGSGSAVATGSGSAGSAAGSGSGSAAPVAAKEPELPTAEDFEEEASTRITEKNLETEVKALEKEIGEN